MNSADNDGDVPLFRAIQSKQQENIKILIECGADVNAVNKAQQNALILAAKSCNSDAINLLLDNYADPNFADLQKNTALHFSTQKKDAKSVSILLDSGANPLSKNIKGRSSFSLASAETLPLFKSAIAGIQKRNRLKSTAASRRATSVVEEENKIDTSADSLPPSPLASPKRAKDDKSKKVETSVSQLEDNNETPADNTNTTIENDVSLSKDETSAQISEADTKEVHRQAKTEFVELKRQVFGELEEMRSHFDEQIDCISKMIVKLRHELLERRKRENALISNTV